MRTPLVLLIRVSEPPFQLHELLYQLHEGEPPSQPHDEGNSSSSC